MTVEEIPEWEGFAVALGGASAVLAGLVFVAVSVNIERLLRVPGLPGRAGESVILFISVLSLCGFVLVPGQSLGALGLELLITGLITWMILNTVIVADGRRPSRQPPSWRVTRFLAVSASTLPAIAAGGSLLGWWGGGLYWLVAGVLASIVTATANAWVLLVEVVRDERYAILDADSTRTA
jgi:hypothetical protein